MVEIITNLLKGVKMPEKLTGIITDISGPYRAMQNLFEDIVWVSVPKKKCWAGFKVDGHAPETKDPEIMKKIGEYTVEKIERKYLHRQQLSYALKKALFFQVFKSQYIEEEWDFPYQVMSYDNVFPVFSFIILSEENEHDRIYLMIDVTSEEFKLNVKGAPKTNLRFKMIENIIKQLFPKQTSFSFNFGDYEFSFETTLERWKL